MPTAFRKGSLLRSSPSIGALSIRHELPSNRHKFLLGPPDSPTVELLDGSAA